MVYPGVVKTDINRLREGPKGQTQSLDMTKGYDVDHAALVIGTQIAEGARDVVMSVDGTATGLVLAKVRGVHIVLAGAATSATCRSSGCRRPRRRTACAKPGAPAVGVHNSQARLASPTGVHRRRDLARPW